MVSEWWPKMSIFGFGGALYDSSFPFVFPCAHVKLFIPQQRFLKVELKNIEQNNSEFLFFWKAGLIKPDFSAQRGLTVSLPVTFVMILFEATANAVSTARMGWPKCKWFFCKRLLLYCVRTSSQGNFYLIVLSADLLLIPVHWCDLSVPVATELIFY